MKKIITINKNRKLKKNTIIVIIIFCIITFLNILSTISSGFSDFYREKVFSHISNVFSKITGIYKYSVGEVMITAAIFILVFAIICFFMGFSKKNCIKKLRKYYFRFVVYVLLFIYLTETCNCFIMYHCTTVEKSLFSGEKYKSIDLSKINISDEVISEENSTDIEKLLQVYNYVTEKINELSLTVKRDSAEDVIGDYSYKECKNALINVSGMFKCLDGYYPSPKKIYYSGIMTQQYIEGMFFPFSMEANYNKLMYPANYPSVICHELSHLKGYIREDEANFISYVACINSDNNFIRYSGYLSVFYYLYNDLYEYGDDEIKERMVSISERGYKDTEFVKKEVFDDVEKNSILSTDVITEATDKFIDGNLKLNGISSGIDNYNEVVKLLILYYSKI